MYYATVALNAVTRIAGAIQVVLGVVFWTGHARALVPVHMLTGFVLVAALWLLAGLAIVSGVKRGLGVVALVWGALVIVLGLTQTNLLPGAHWIVQATHLFLASLRSVKPNSLLACCAIARASRCRPRQRDSERPQRLLGIA